MSIFRRDPPEQAATRRVPYQADWSVRQTQHEGRPMIVRCDVGQFPLSRHPAYGHQVGIAVPLLAPDDQGLPLPPELEMLERLEEDIVMTMCRDSTSVLVAVVTTSGMREFVLYTRSSESVKAHHVTIAQRYPTHDIQLLIQPDPDWQVFEMLATD